MVLSLSDYLMAGIAAFLLGVFATILLYFVQYLFDRVEATVAAEKWLRIKIPLVLVCLGLIASLSLGAAGVLLDRSSEDADEISATQYSMLNTLSVFAAPEVVSDLETAMRKGKITKSEYDAIYKKHEGLYKARQKEELQKRFQKPEH